MKWSFYLPLLLIFSFSGCGLQEREARLQEKEIQLTQKEQELVVKEKNLQLKEQELILKEKQLNQGQGPAADTAGQQAGGIFYPGLIGKWNATMTCIETTCTGSAIGDTKTETWEMSYQGPRVIARVMAGEGLVRIYTGSYRNNLLELTENVALSSAAPATKMVVRLTLLDQTTLEGRREIIRTGECRIIYALQLEKL